MTEKIKILEIGTEEGKKDGIVYLRFRRVKNKFKPYFTIGINERYLKQSYYSDCDIMQKGTSQKLTIANYYNSNKTNFLYQHEHSVSSKIFDYLTHSDELIQNIGIETLKIELEL